MQDTFTGKEERSLQELCFSENKTVMVETKASHEQFEEYDAHLLMIKLNMWREGIESLDENILKPTVVYIRDDKVL